MFGLAENIDVIRPIDFIINRTMVKVERFLIVYMFDKKENNRGDKKVGVLCAGTMGAGISQVSVEAGYSVKQPSCKNVPQVTHQI